MKKTEFRAHIICVALVLMLTVFSFFHTLVGGTAQVSAATAGSEGETASNIMDDLYKDGDFDIAEYPYNADNYKLQVIQIAESESKELYIYVYQPCGNKYLANSVKMSLSDILKDKTEEVIPDFGLYKLEYKNSEGVFFKYKVLKPIEPVLAIEKLLGLTLDKFIPFEVEDKPVRYYEIVSISRPVVESDGSAKDEFGNVTNYKAYEVGQLWTAATENGKVSYAMTTSESVIFKSTYAGYISYTSSSPGWLIIFGVGGDWACHAHFLAFSSDWKIDKLIEAKITYKSRTITNDGPGAWGRSERVINYKEKGTAVIKDGAFSQNSHHYDWERIQTVDDFILKNDLDETVRNKLEGKQWVLNFTETGYDNHYWLGMRVDYKKTEIEEIDVLQLKFEKDGKTYNLGVVSNTVSESKSPDKTVKSDYVDWLSRIINNCRNFFNRFKWLFWLIVAVVALSVALPILSHFFPAVKAVLKTIGKGLVWLITAPFRGVKAFVVWCRNRKNGGAGSGDKKGTNDK